MQTIVFNAMGPAGLVQITGLAADSELITLPVSGTYIVTAIGIAKPTGLIKRKSAED